jgi:hypothetical protein
MEGASAVSPPTPPSRARGEGGILDQYSRTSCPRRSRRRLILLSRSRCRSHTQVAGCMISWREQAANTFSGVDATDRLAEERCHRDDLYLLRKRHRLGFDRIRHQEILDGAPVESLH